MVIQLDDNLALLLRFLRPRMRTSKVWQHNALWRAGHYKQRSVDVEGNAKDTAKIQIELSGAYSSHVQRNQFMCSNQPFPLIAACPVTVTHRNTAEHVDIVMKRGSLLGSKRA